MNRPNHLAQSNSPYLLQHADNPVEWHQWGDEALDLARREDRPLFISIGYSTCHWCHVMAHESFEDEETAILLNDAFICIKVDREERPDIDAFYMNAAVMLTGTGGWPLTIIATPEGIPFFAGTYIPREDSSRHMGLKNLVIQVKNLWLNERDKINQSAVSVDKAIRQSELHSMEKHTAHSDSEIVQDAYEQLRASFDPQDCGFGGSPKFPQPHNIFFLMRYWKVYGYERALRMCTTTLKHMRAGGMFDQIGYGFHRYSTDSAWKVPHFEKMLYDQALLLRAYTEAFQVSGNEVFRKTSYEILEFLRNEMRSPEGGWYSAIDADSEGEEGLYYLWEYDDFMKTMESVPGVQNPGRWAQIFNIEERGNWSDSVSGEMQATNIPYCKTDDLRSLEDGEWEACRAALLERRAGRVAPSMDDKILSGWNGLVISAAARTAWVFSDTDALKEAQQAADFILQEMRSTEGGLLHSYRGGRANILGNLEDYAFCIDGLISLYQADFEPAHIEAAIELTDYTLEHFYDEGSGGFFLTDDQVEDIPGRTRSVYDSAMPSGISILLHSIDALFRISSDIKYRTAADGLKNFILSYAMRNPGACTMSLSLPEWIGLHQTEVVITGEGDEADGMIEVLRRRFMPETLILRKNERNAEKIGGIAPYTISMGPQTAAYVCTDFQCSAPVKTAFELEDLLDKLDKNTRNK